jgi:rRNA maturation endonuclease Nob1
MLGSMVLGTIPGLLAAQQARMDAAACQMEMVINNLQIHNSQKNSHKPCIYCGRKHTNTSHKSCDGCGAPV